MRTRIEVFEDTSAHRVQMKALDWADKNYPEYTNLRVCSASTSLAFDKDGVSHYVLTVVFEYDRVGKE